MLTALLWSMGWMLIAIVLPIIDALTEPWEFATRDWI